jgi:molecular chaperone DnaJ
MKFKRSSEKSQYDQYGHQALMAQEVLAVVEWSGGMNMDDIFSQFGDIFGGFGGFGGGGEELSR